MLYILKALVLEDGQGPITSYTIAPDSAAMSFDHAVARLVRTEKPIACSGHRIEGNLTLSCVLGRGPGPERVMGDLVTRDVTFVRERLQVTQRKWPRHDRIELLAGTDRFVLTVDGYERWKEDYTLAEHNLMTMHYADGTGADRVGLVWKVSRPHGIEVQVRLR
jgi:hypothetical protein